MATINSGSANPDVWIVGADLTQLGLTPEELEIVKQTKWFKEGGNLMPKAAGGKKLLEDIFHKIFPGKTLKDLTPEEWDIAYDYILKKYNNNPSNILQKIRDYHFYTAAPDTIVKEASGKPLQVFHGGTSPNIREFSLDIPNNASLTDILDKRIYFSDKKGIASQYTVDPEYKLALTIDHLADAVGLDKEGLEIIASRLKMPIKDIKKIIKDYKIGLNFVKRKTNEEDFIYPVYLNIRKHADVDLDGDVIARLSKEQRAKINSEPGAIIRNVDESVSNQYGIRVAPSTDYLVQYPQQIKRSAAITYDTNRNIIPISKRDNFHNPDINFKNGGNIEYFSKNSTIKVESGIKAILNAAGGHLIKKHQFGKILEKINPVEIFKQRAMSKGIKKSALDEIKKFNLKSEKGRQAAAEYIVSLDKLSGKQAEDAIEQYKAFFKDASTKMEKGASVDGAPIIHSEPRETEFKTQIQDAHEMFHNLIPKCETPIPEEAIDPIDLLDLHPKAKNPIYFLDDNNNEVAARISQVLSAHGVTDARNITGKELKQMFESYLDSPSVINDQVDFIKNAVKNWDVLAKWVNNPRNVLLAPVAIETIASFAALTEAPKQTPYNKNGGTLNKFQEGGTLSKWSIEQELPIFRHLKNSQLAQNIDQDLDTFFAKGEIQYGQLSKDARRELQRKYNLDQRQIKETLDDLYNVGLGKALIADLITANTNLAAFKTGGVIQKCSIGSAIKKFAGKGLAGIEQKIIKETGENVVLQATGNTKVIGKATTEHLKKIAKATNDQRIKVLADFAEQCRDKGIKLPEEFNQFVDSIFKTPVATKTDKKIIRVGKEVTADPEIITHNGVSIERPTFDKIKYKTKTVHTGEFKDKLEFKRTIPKTQQELQELSPKIDEAINSLRSMMEGDSFKLTPTMMDEIYYKSKGRVQNFKGNKEQTRALRKLFGEIEYPTLVKRQLDSLYIYPQAPSQELARFYNANAENIEWFKKIRNLAQHYVNDTAGKVQVTPLKITPRKQQVAVYHREGDYVSFLPKQIMTKQDIPYIKAYRLTIDGKPIKGTPTFNFEEHHSTPLSLMQAEAYLTNPNPKNAMEHVLTYQNQRKVNGSKDAHYNKFLVLDKSEHTGVKGIHYNDKWSLQDLQRIKALARSGRFKTMDDLLYYYDRLKAQQLSYLPKAKSGTKLIPKNYSRKDTTI